jgi:hypothetical protein
VVAELAEIRTLKLNLLADVDQFGRGINQAEASATKLGSTASKVSKIATAAFAAMGTAAAFAAVRIGKDSVQAAIEDEKSQTQLAQALKNVTNATDSQIASTEKWITKQQYATGISDSQLRPALATLTRATGDLTKAQSLTVLAQDIAVGTGKDLESVSLALAKAYNGNLGALTRLGIPLDENIKKTGDFNAASEQLAKLFGGAAAANADTYAGRLAIVQQRIGELKEGIGADLLVRLDGLLKKVNEVAMGFGGEQPNSLSNKVKTLQGELGTTGAYSLGKSLKDVADAFGRLFQAISNPDNKAGIDNLERLANAMEKLANGIDKVANAYKSGRDIFNKFKGLDTAIGDFLNPTRQGRAMGGSVRAGQAYTVGEFGKETFIPNTNGQIVPNNRLGGGNTTINLNGIIDAESARRSIERLLQDSGRRTAAINLVGSAF